MARLAVLGLGNWGSALARVWLAAGHSVRGWTVEREVYASIASSGVNRKYLDGIDLSGLKVSMHLQDALPDSEIVVLAVPSSVVLDVVDDVIPLIDSRQVLLDVAKGLAPGEQLVSDSISDRLRTGGKTNSIAVVTGPTIATEVAQGVLTTALVASHNRELAQRLAQTLSTPTLILHAASDPKGAELWGAFKNVIALACGIVDGLRSKEGISGDNLKAAVLTAGFRGGCQLLPALGAAAETALGPAGIGDIYVTATSPHGRNRHLGEMLGRGERLEEALGQMVMVAEGVRATRMFVARAERLGIRVPFLSAVDTLLEGHISAEECVRRIVAIS